jgi:hypothetical protein
LLAAQESSGTPTPGDVATACSSGIYVQGIGDSRECGQHGEGFTRGCTQKEYRNASKPGDRGLESPLSLEELHFTLMLLGRPPES